MESELREIWIRIMAMRNEVIVQNYLSHYLSDIKYLLEECIAEIEDGKSL